MSSSSVSVRASAVVSRQNEPWRGVPATTYDPETNPGGVICFAMAENMLMLPETKSVFKTINAHPADFTITGTAGGGPSLPAIWASHVTEYLNPWKPIEASNIRLSGASTAMHDILAWALADPGDAILLSRPVYGQFESDFRTRSEVETYYADTDAETCFAESVVDKFEEVVANLQRDKAKAKALFIVNPHNPLGRCYPKDTLIALMKFCSKHKLHLISDEIYACSVFDSGEPDAVPFTSVLSLDTDQYIDPQYLHVSYGLSKTFAVASMNVGSIISHNTALLAAMSDALEFSIPSGASIAMARTMIGDKEKCRRLVVQNRENLAKAYRHAARGFDEIGIKYLRGSNAGFFLWIDLSAYLPDHESPEYALAQKLLDGGVALKPKGEHSGQPGWFRFVYTHDPAVVTEGLRRIKSIIDSSG